MTLEPYDTERLDGMSLRLLDICARMRNLARRSRDEKLPPLDLHDRKALEWMEKLEQWLLSAEAAAQRASWVNRGETHARRARSARPK